MGSSGHTGRDITPKKHSAVASEMAAKFANLNQSQDSETKAGGRVKMAVASTSGKASVPVAPSGKVKKTKLNKLTKEQIGQIRSQPVSGKITSASLGSKSHQIFV